MIQSLKQIKTRIRSTENTKRVTQAMELISVAKLNRIEKGMLSLRPYVAKLGSLIQGLINSQEIGMSSFSEPNLATDKICLCVITSDSGLCGAYNNNIIRLAEEFISKRSLENINLVCIGRKGFNYFRRKNLNILHTYMGMNGRYTQEIAGGITDKLVDIFVSGKAREVYIAYTHFKTALIHKPMVEKFLNIERIPQKETEYILEPDKQAILDEIFPKYICMKLKLIILEAFTAEHSARTVAMKTATDNAGDLLQSLVLWRNKVRQANITREITEIISSSEALKG
ncbi:MAG: ATP synthase F1 subunit gamma [Candidatus Omnitrophota bacterium]